VIRQAISCDICGTEMQRTNHWFVAYDQKTELRVSVWTPRSRLRAGAKHLCGQTCLHKLVDDFMARSLSGHSPSDASELGVQEKTSRMDASLTSRAPYPAQTGPNSGTSDAYIDEYESSAHLIPPPEPIAGRDGPSEKMPSFSSRTWRAEAWKREREREESASRHPAVAVRQRSIA